MSKSVNRRDLTERWVWESRLLRWQEKLLLVTVRDYANSDGWFRGCVPELAFWTGLDQSEVEANRLDLIARGFLLYTDEPEKVWPHDCAVHQCTGVLRADHAHRIRLAGPPDGATNGVVSAAALTTT